MKNQFFDAELADQIATRDRIEMLARKSEDDPDILLSLELEDLGKINQYYDEIIRKKEEELAYLRNSATG